MTELEETIQFIDSPVFKTLSRDTQLEILMKEHNLIKSHSNNDFDEVIETLKNLNRNKTGNCLAPHKPIMLLAIIKLLGNGHYTNNRIVLDQELKETFKIMWNKYVPEDCTFACQYRNPFMYMDKTFWTLEASGNSAIISDSVYAAFQNENAKSRVTQLLIDMATYDSVDHSSPSTDSPFISKAAENVISILPAVALSMIRMIG